MEPSFDDMKIIDFNSNVFKLMTLEALYLIRMKPSINTRDEYKKPYANNKNIIVLIILDVLWDN